MKLGIIGGGSIANWHLDAYKGNPRLENVLLADPAPKPHTIEKLKAAFPATKIVPDYRDLLGEVDAVDICLPHDMHAETAIEAMKAGRDVITEKPISNTSRDGLAMIEASKKLGKKLLVVMNHAYTPQFLKAREIVKSGGLGRVFMELIHVSGNEFATMNIRDHWKGDKVRAGGGVLVDTGYHAMYLTLDLFGMPKSVTAVTRRILVEPENKGDDNCAVTLEFPGGAIATLSLSYTIFHEPWTERRYVYGTDGSIAMSDDPAAPFALYRNHKVVETMEWKYDNHPQGVGMTTCLNLYLDCLAGKAQPMLPPEHSLNVLKTIEACYKASETGRRIDL
ncbi:MAG TPA: Gfo/Idh/MocA family oxidoreductase [Candidatus Brocadiia bacterium]|nr:Gfo/Idh/MocA family oxidoreductase [Candidatus Brocadiia bacterium]